MDVSSAYFMIGILSKTVLQLFVYIEKSIGARTVP
jgi:hypothetical protein